MSFTFFLGTDRPQWLGFVDVPLFVSYARLRRRTKELRARAPWCLDSGGFMELKTHGRWRFTAATYAEAVRDLGSRIGMLQWAAVQDWMCEPFILEKTGLAVADHQRLTTESVLELRRLAPDVPWAPVLQGWVYDDYMAHVEAYRVSGIDLRAEPVVAVGSVCRRQDTTMAEELFRDLHANGVRCHAFGFKVTGLRRVARYLASSDSMAWCLNAWMNKIKLPGCDHVEKTCVHCPTFALRWRDRVLRAARSSINGMEQGLLFEGKP